jgi:hypothetical protein
MRLTFKTVNESDIPDSLQVCAGDPRLFGWYNDAQERILNSGRWWGTVKSANFCVTDSCIVLPREIATVEMIGVCHDAMKVESIWGQFGGPVCCETCHGCSSGTFTCGHMRYQERNSVASYSVTTGVNKKIRVYSDPADNGKTIVIQGYDFNRIWVRKDHGLGLVNDGELITLASPFVDTVTVWSAGAPTNIIKDPTTYPIRLYELNTENSALRAIAYYQPSEEVPVYRSGFIPEFPAGSCCEGQVNVSAVVKLAHVPVKSENDILVLENLAAIAMGMQASKAYRELNYDFAHKYMYGPGGAIHLLKSQNRTMTGDRTTLKIKHGMGRFRADMAGFK